MTLRVVKILVNWQAKESDDRFLRSWTSYVYGGDSRYLKMKARMDVFNKVFLFLLHQMSKFVINLNRSILGLTLVPRFCEGSDAPV